jgi:catalase
MFYRSLTPLEQAHIVEAFTFELGKCYEQAIKERELQVLANVDADLCAQVAAGLGLPAPDGSPAPEDALLSRLSRRSSPSRARSRAARSASSPTPAPTSPASTRSARPPQSSARPPW